MKVSFDFDGTLQRADVQEYAKKLIDKGVEVWVVTTRWDENHKHKYANNPTIDDLWEVVDKLGIPKHHVRFTNMEWKYIYLDNTSFAWHLDDNDAELHKAHSYNCTVPMVYVEKHDWEDRCESILNGEEIIDNDLY